jgi:hypothetical protein
VYGGYTFNTYASIELNSGYVTVTGPYTEELASKIGISSSDLQFLRYQNGRDGAIGLLIGLLINE